MDDIDDLDAYNGSPEHDSWVDFDYHENTGELFDRFYDNVVDSIVNNLNE